MTQVCCTEAGGFVQQVEYVVLGAILRVFDKIKLNCFIEVIGQAHGYLCLGRMSLPAPADATSVDYLRHLIHNVRRDTGCP